MIEPIKYLITDVGHPTELYLEEKRDDSWTITDRGMCMTKHFYFAYEPLPSNRTPEFLQETRFTFNEAIKHLEEFARRNKHHAKHRFNLDTASRT
jgi:hypothetical protein